MEVIHPRCGGLDVHKQTVVACVRLTSGGKVTREVKTFETTTSGLLLLRKWLTDMGCTHVAMEATGVYWRPVWNILSDGDFELVLANAAHIKNVPGRKTDVGDAVWIADLLAHGLIRSSFVPEQEIQELRELLRTRKQLTRQQPYPKASEDPGSRQHQIRLGHHRSCRQERTGDDLRQFGAVNRFADVGCVAIGSSNCHQHEARPDRAPRRGQMGTRHRSWAQTRG